MSGSPPTSRTCISNGHFAVLLVLLCFPFAPETKPFCVAGEFIITLGQIPRTFTSRGEAMSLPDVHAQVPVIIQGCSLRNTRLGVHRSLGLELPSRRAEGKGPPSSSKHLGKCCDFSPLCEAQAIATGRVPYVMSHLHMLGAFSTRRRIAQLRENPHYSREAVIERNIRVVM